MDHKFLKYTRKSMILVGAWKLKIANEYLSKFYKIWTILSQTYYISFCVSFTIGMKYVLTDPTKLADTQQYLLLSLLLLWKLILSQSGRIRKQVAEIIIWETTIEESSGINRIYRKNTEYNHRIFLSLATMYFMTCCQYVFNGYKYWLHIKNNHESEKALIFTGWFPFDSERHFDVAYFFQLSVGIFVGMYSLSFDSLIISLIMVPTTRLRILRHKFGRFGDVESNNSFSLLRNLILEHQDIIRYVENLNESLKWYFFGDFLIKSYHISLVLVMNQNKSALVFSMFFVLYLLTQVWCFYYHANELILESNNLANSIFQSKWYNLDLRMKKSLLIIMMRSQRPLELRIGNLQTIDNGLFVKIMKAAYTFLICQNWDI